MMQKRGGTMDVICYKYFYELACGTGFSAVSELNSISESSLSKNISRLESELGCRLFDRSVRPMALTEKGMALKEHLEKLIPMYDSMVRELSDKGRLVTYCAINTLERYNLRAFCAEFAREHHEVALRQYEEDMSNSGPFEFILRIERGEADFAVMHESIFITPGLKRYFLKDDNASVIMSEGHPLSGMASIPPECLCSYDVLGLGCTEDIARELKYKSGVNIEVQRMQANEIELFPVIAAGGAVSLHYDTDFLGYNLANYGVVARPLEGIGPMPLILLASDRSDESVELFARSFKEFLDALPSSLR